jgi:hypothetical protein
LSDIGSLFQELENGLDIHANLDRWKLTCRRQERIQRPLEHALGRIVETVNGKPIFLTHG